MCSLATDEHPCNRRFSNCWNEIVSKVGAPRCDYGTLEIFIILNTAYTRHLQHIFGLKHDQRVLS